MTVYQDERNFGVTVGGVFVVIAALQYWRGRPSAAAILLAVGLVLLIAGAVAPRALVVPNQVWRRVGHVLAWINTRILLTAFFLLVLAPFGLVRRAFGADPLGRRGSGSTWTAYRARIRDPHHFERQF